MDFADEDDGFDPFTQEEEGNGEPGELEELQEPQIKKKGKGVKVPGVTRRGRGRPKKSLQATVVGSSNQNLVAKKKKSKLPKFEEPQFDEPFDRTIGTADLLDRLDSRNCPPSPGSHPSSPGRAEDDTDSVLDAIDYYEELWTKYPHLKLVPDLERMKFSATTPIRIIEREIEKIEDLGTRPFRDKLYTQIWNIFSYFVGQGAARTPWGPILEPERTPLTPNLTTLSEEMMKPDVLKEAKPVVEELCDMLPLLDYLHNLDDPRVRLAYAMAVAVHTTVQKNTLPRAQNERPFSSS